MQKSFIFELKFPKFAQTYFRPYKIILAIVPRQKIIFLGVGPYLIFFWKKNTSFFNSKVLSIFFAKY